MARACCAPQQEVGSCLSASSEEANLLLLLHVEVEPVEAGGVDGGYQLAVVRIVIQELPVQYVPGACKKTIAFC